jgi:hypothetical protein
VTWVKWKLVSVSIEVVLILIQDRCTDCAECVTAQKSFWAHPMELLGDVGQLESCFGPLGDGVNLGVK